MKRDLLGINLQYKGNWDTTTSYVPLDLVIYNNKMWCAKTNSQGKTPTTSSSAWSLVSNRDEKTPIPIQDTKPLGKPVGSLWFKGINVLPAEEIKMTLKIVSSPSSFSLMTFTLPMQENEEYDFYVDWGDGSLIEHITSVSDNHSHTYGGFGTYSLKINGKYGFMVMNNPPRGMDFDNGNMIYSIDKCSASTNFIMYGCKNLVFVSSIDFISTSIYYGLGTLSGQYYVGMFYGCSNLTTVPKMSAEKATTLSNAFYECTSLTNESLNNILYICTTINTQTYQTPKTLKDIGLTSEQASICETLSNYSAFTNAGWTTGY